MNKLITVILISIYSSLLFANEKASPCDAVRKQMGKELSFVGFNPAAGDIGEKECERMSFSFKTNEDMAAFIKLREQQGLNQNSVTYNGRIIPIELDIGYICEGVACESDKD